MMDSVYFGGRLITMDEDCREATAMAVKDGVIQAVGGDERSWPWPAPPPSASTCAAPA